MTIARKGKVARLPVAIRNKLNEKLLDNVAGPSILSWVNREMGFKGPAAITAQNLSEWRAGGFADWLENQDKVDRVKQLSELAFRLAQTGGNTITESAAAIAGGQVLSILEDFDVETQKALMAEKPGNYLDLLDRIARLQKSGADERKIKQNERKLNLDERKLQLDEQKFQRQTAELFLKFYDDRKAKEIAEGKAGKSVKIEQLKLLIFGENPNRKGNQ
jgi:hypothetical protein